MVNTNKTFLKVFLTLLAYTFNFSFGQFSQAERDTIAKYTQIDYQQMIDLLDLQKDDLRPGASGNPQAPNAANSSEEKVNQYTLPDPLILKNGKRVENAEIWWEKRRPEIVEDFERDLWSVTLKYTGCKLGSSFH